MGNLRDRRHGFSRLLQGWFPVVVAWCPRPLLTPSSQLKSLPLCRNILRALTAADLPPLEAFPRAQQVTFHYYVGVLAFLNEEYTKAETELSVAFDACHASQRRNQS